jgi:DtxR family transcriptional regulator, Mn-dependent transcriptional regulator
MPSVTVENYLKQLLLQQELVGGGLVPMGQLATAMNVTPGTATTMVKALSDSNLVTYEPRGGVRLTRGGQALATHVLRRHRLVELFLVQVLKLDWSEVHAEAEELEHAISEKVLERIDELLGRPSADPHGDPIPSASGKLPEPRLSSLADCRVNAKLRVARVRDQNASFLQFADQRGLRPGVEVTVESRDADADAVHVRVHRAGLVTVGTTAAAKILVRAGD